MPEKSIRNAGPAEFATVAVAGWTGGIDRLPAKSTRNGGPAVFAVIAGVGWADGKDRLPEKSILSGGAVPSDCPVAGLCCEYPKAIERSSNAVHIAASAKRLDPIANSCFSIMRVLTNASFFLSAPLVQPATL